MVRNNVKEREREDRERKETNIQKYMENVQRQ